MDSVWFFKEGSASSPENKSLEKLLYLLSNFHIKLLGHSSLIEMLTYEKFLSHS